MQFFRYTSNLVNMKTWLPLLAGIIFSLPVFSQLQLSFEKTDPTCFNYTNGIAIVNPSGGVEPYTYSWQNGLTWNQWWGIAAGTYSVTVTDAVGATKSGSVTLNHPNLLVINIDGINVACEGANSSLTAKPTGGTFPYYYNWNNNQETQTVTGITAGDWLVTVLDSKGCHDVGTRFVDVQSQIFPNMIPTNPICFGSQEGQIVSNTFGNHPPFQYQWSTGSQSNMVSEVGAGTYSVSITDANNCTLVFQQSLTTNSQVDVAVQATPATCFEQNDGAVGAFVTGGIPPYISFNWEKNGQGIGNQPIFQNVGPGTYSVTVVDNTGCTGTGSGVVLEPAELLVSTSITPTPTGGTVQINATGGNPPYTMTLDAQPINSLTLNLPFKNYYYLCVKDSKGCQIDVPFEILNSTTTNCLTVQLLTSSTNCDQQSTGSASAIVTAGGTGSYSFQWSPPAQNLNVPIQNNLGAGIYSVTITDLNNGCTGIATAEVKAHTVIVLDMTSTSATCPHSTDGTASVSAFNGVQPYSYLWSNGGQTATISGLAPGTFQVTVTDAAGCTQAATVAVGTVSTLNAAFTPTFGDCIGNQVSIHFTDNSTLAGQITDWAWTFATGTTLVNSSLQTPPDQLLDKDQTITVQLTVSDANGCTDIESKPIVIPGGPDFTLADSLSDCADVVLSTVGAAGLIYTWSPTTGLDLTDPANPIASQSGTYTGTATNAAGCTATQTVVVDIEPALNLSAVEVPINPCDKLSSLSATATGATTFNWFLNGVLQTATGPNFSVDPLTGPATIIVEATNGACTEKDTIEVTATPLIDSIVGKSDYCVNEPVNLSVIANAPIADLNFTWSPGNFGNVASINISSTAPFSQLYTVIVENEVTGCLDTLEKMIEVKLGEVLDSSIQMIRCNGLEVVFWIDPIVAGTWNFGDGTTSTLDSVSHFFGTQGNYMISFTPDEECYQKFEYLLTVLNQQVIAADFEFTLGDSCTTDVELFLKDKSTSQASILLWNWTYSGLSPNMSTGPNPPTITVNQNGTYNITLIVESAVGCKDTVTLPVLVENLFTPPVLADFSICPGDVVTLNPGGNTMLIYDWSNPLNDVPSPTASPATTTTFTVQVTKGDCLWDGDVTVTVKAEAALTAPADFTVCNDDQLTLTATSSNATGFEWKKGGSVVPGGSDGSIDIIPALGENVYIVTANGNNLICPNVDTVIVINGVINVAADPADGELHPCTGKSDTIEVLNFNPLDVLTYTWNPSGMTGPIQIVNPGNDATYLVTVSNQFGCLDTLTFTIDVINLQPEIELTASNDTICPGEEIFFDVIMSGTSGPYTYEWTPATGLSSTTVANPVSTTGESLEYTVVVTDKYGCTAMDKARVEFVNPTCGLPYVFIPNAFSPFDGNNVNNEFCVRGTNIRSLELMVYDRWGEKVFATTTVGDCWDGTFKGEQLTADAYGYYVRVICTEGQVYTKKGNVTLLR